MTSGQRGKLEELKRLTERLSPWEREFIETLDTICRESLIGVELTGKEAMKLEEIYEDRITLGDVFQSPKGDRT